MKHITKRVTALALAAVMALGLSACGKTPASQSGDEQITLTIGIPAKTNVLEWDNNALTLWLEEQTGYNLEFVHFSSNSGEAKTQLTTMVAGGDTLPDLLLNFGLTAEEQATYGQDGYLLDLATFFDDPKVMKNYEYDEMVAKNLDPEMLKRLYTEGRDAEGHWWGFPYIGSSINDQPANMIYINTTWLDKLGLEKPTNLEELEQVATAFLTQDPNGNGKADEIPIMGWAGATTKGDIPSWIINNFVYLNDRYLYNVDEDGQVYLPYDMDEYREGIKAVKSLYDKNLLNSMTWTIQERSELTALWTPADGVAKVGIIGGHILTSLTTDSPVMYEYEYLEPFEDAYAAHGPLSLTFKNFITTDCQHPEAAFDLLCTLATPEGSRAQRYGVEGEDWHWVTDYATGIQGIEVLNADAYGGQTTSTWGVDINTTYWKVSDEQRDVKDPQPVFVADPNPPGEQSWATVRKNKNIAHAEAYMAHAAETDPENLIYSLTLTSEETAELGNIEANINSYVEEMRAYFITGVLDINDDAAWQKYVTDLHKLGTETALRIAQAAYDRTQAQLGN